jgi:hypothetical protein
MKISDIKGSVAFEINNKLLKEYNRILTEYNSIIDQNIYSKIPLIPEVRGLFDYNKDLKMFLSTGTSIFYPWWWNNLSKTAKGYFKFNKSKKTHTDCFEYEDSIFSTKLEIKSNAYIYRRNSVEYQGVLTVVIKDPTNFLSDISNSIKNTIGSKFKALTDFRGVEIQVGDIVVYSDCNYSQVQLGKVTKLNDVRVTIDIQERLINKNPIDLIVVSRELITKI